MPKRPVEDRPHSKAMASGGGANQSDRNTTDINSIVANYHSTGLVSHVSSGNPLYGDFTGPMDLQDQMDRVHVARERFARLPAAIRKACGNDPVQFLAMAENPESLKTLTDLGLVVDAVHDQAEGSTPQQPTAEADTSTEPQQPAPSPES